jgi:hypothetical protein
MKNHHKSLKSAVIVLAAFFLFIAPVHDAMLQAPPMEIYTIIEVDNNNDADGAETCSEFVCCTFEKILLIRSEPKP